MNEKSEWIEKFYVLTNIGLMIMDNQSSEKVEIYQYIEFKVVSVSDQSYNRKFCFEIKPKVPSESEA